MHRSAAGEWERRRGEGGGVGARVRAKA